MPAPSDRWCVVCGRTITWRRKWRDDWDQVKYCSAGCRRTGVSAVDEQLEDGIVELLGTRARGATICPSEVARAVGGDEWRPLMEPTRRAARRLVHREVVEITQRGHVVDPSTAKGPIRIRRRDR